MRLAGRFAFPALAAGLLAAAGPAHADERLLPPYDLYETPPLPDAALESLRLEGWKALHQERVDGATWMLLVLPDGVFATDVGGTRPRYLGRVRAGERVVLVAPPQVGEERLRTGRPVTITPSGAGVSVTSEAPGRLARRGHGAWRTVERALPAPRPRADGPPAAFRAALERASRVRADELGLRTAQDVRDVVDRVRADSLEKHVRRLSQRPSGAPDSRWWDPGAPGAASSIVAKSDYVRAKFEEALGPGSVSQHGVDIVNDAGQTVRVYNLVARHPSPVPGAGAFLLTAHLDAIGLRSNPRELWAHGYKVGSGCDSTAFDTDPDCAWDPATDPAPGADDNATGVAALLEAARLLKDLEFDFDLYFVAFTAEEIGLVGSAAFADSVARAGRDVYGVLNIDMLGYNAQTNEVDVVSDASSQWLADWVVESAQQFVSQLPVEKKVEPFGRSDHASFWARGIDAVLLNEDTRILYPRYHTFLDTWENTFPASGRPNSQFQLQLSVQLAVAALARFAVQHTSPDLALPAGELVATPLVGRSFVSGRTIRLTANVHNFGNSSLTFLEQTTDSLTARVTFFLGDPDEGGAPLAEVTKKTFFAGGGIVRFETLWDTGGQPSRFVEIFARVEGLDIGYVQEEVSTTNNESSVSFFLEAPESEGPRVLAHYAYPNPVRGSRADLRLYYELTREGGVEIGVYDLDGALVGEFRASSDLIADGNRAGPNTISGSAFAWKGPVLESGVYLYAIRVTGAGRTDRTRGKFALVR